jgi:hypothetical protein
MKRRHAKTRKSRGGDRQVPLCDLCSFSVPILYEPLTPAMLVKPPREMDARSTFSLDRERHKA